MITSRARSERRWRRPMAPTSPAIIVNALTRSRRICPGRRQRQRRQGHRPCHQAHGHRDRDPQRRLDHSQPGRQRRKGRRGPVRIRFDGRHHLHRRHRVRPVVECEDGAQRNGLRPERVEQFIADQPGGGHHLLCRRRDRQARRHEDRHAGRDHGHSRHRGAGRDRLRRSGPGRRARRQIPGSGRAGRHHGFIHPVTTRPRWRRSRRSIRPDNRSTSARASSASHGYAGLSADMQKLITDVFAQKFTDNTNTKTSII